MDQMEELIIQNLGLVGWIARQYTGRGVDYEELFSAGREGLIEAANRFKPDRGVKFSTYAVYYIRGRIREVLRLLSPAEELNEEIASSTSDARSDNLARAKSALSMLDEPSQRILRLRLGLDYERKRTLREVGRELGISYVTVWRLEKRALAEMRRIIEERPVLPRHHPSGLSRQEYQRRYREGNHQLKEQIQSWWQEHPGYYKSWLLDHPGYHKRWRLKNLERRRAYEREYKRRRRHPMSIKKTEK